jgi:hypothetical protein
MSAELIAIIGVAYAYIGYDQVFVKHQTGLGIAFWGYAIGNIGLFMQARGH